MPTYKLIYFNGRGRAEIIRQVFALGGQDFEDYRLKEGEWATFKPTAPFGQAPFLEIDDGKGGKVKLSQSLSIARYLARQFGVAGKDELEQAKVDMIVDCVEDFIKPLMAVFRETTEEGKNAVKKKFLEEQSQPALEKFEKMLSESKSGFFVGDEITWCDLQFAIVVDAPKAMGVDVGLEKYPAITAFKQKVESNPKIAAWLAKRPPSAF